MIFFERKRKPPYGSPAKSTGIVLCFFAACFRRTNPSGSRVQLAIWRSQGDLSPTLSEGSLLRVSEIPAKGSI